MLIKSEIKAEFPKAITDKYHLIGRGWGWDSVTPTLYLCVDAKGVVSAGWGNEINSSGVLQSRSGNEAPHYHRTSTSENRYYVELKPKVKEHTIHETLALISKAINEVGFTVKPLPNALMVEEMYKVVISEDGKVTLVYYPEPITPNYHLMEELSYDTERTEHDILSSALAGAEYYGDISRLIQQTLTTI